MAMFSCKHGLAVAFITSKCVHAADSVIGAWIVEAFIDICKIIKHLSLLLVCKLAISDWVHTIQTLTIAIWNAFKRLITSSLDVSFSPQHGPASHFNCLELDKHCTLQLHNVSLMWWGLWTYMAHSILLNRYISFVPSHRARMSFLLILVGIGIGIHDHTLHGKFLDSCMVKDHKDWRLEYFQHLIRKNLMMRICTSYLVV